MRLVDNPPDDGAFAEWVARYLDGALSTPELRQLNQRLLADSEARSLFVRIARLHGMLAEQSLASREETRLEEIRLDDDGPAPPATTSADTTSLDDATIRPAIHEEELIPDPSDLAEIGVPVDGIETVPAEPDRSRWKLAVITGVAAMLLIGCSLAVWLWPRSPMVPNSPLALVRPIPAPKIAPALPKVPGPSAISAKIPNAVTEPLLGAAIDVQWGGTDPAPTPGQAIPLRPLQLDAGWVRLDFASGVSVVVEAPAQFQVQSTTQMALTVGSLSAQVPVAGHGFAVQAPFCRVVDLGTEFGLAVQPDGRHDVQVFKGAVALDRPVVPGRPASNQILSAGQGRRITSQHADAVVTVADNDLFLRRDKFDQWQRIRQQGDNANPIERWRTFSEQMRRDPTLMLYYTFDDRDTDPNILKNHAAATAGSYDLAIQSPAPTWVEGRFPGLSSLDFDPAQHQRLLLSSYPLTPNGQLSCAAWVRARSIPPFASIAKSWGVTTAGAFHFGFLPEGNVLEAELDGSTPGGPRVSEVDGKPFPTGAWVHVAFTTDGKICRLFRDGVEVGSGPSRPIAVNQPITSLALGFKTGDDAVSPAPSPQDGLWDGQIGEFALYHRAVSADEIARMYAAGKPQ